MLITQLNEVKNVILIICRGQTNTAYALCMEYEYRIDACVC